MLENSTGIIIIFASIFASLSAQLIKLILKLVIHRQWNFAVIFSTGGMPSSHSALVSALVASVGLLEGWFSVNFAIALAIAMIVMHDAISIRHSVGVQARSLNNLQVLFNDVVTEMFSDRHELKLDKIKELLGHTPIEVFVGSLYGIFIGFVTVGLVKYLGWLV